MVYKDNGYVFKHYWTPKPMNSCTLSVLSLQGLYEAAQFAEHCTHNYIGTEHLLYGMLEVPHPFAELLGLRVSDVKEDISDILGIGPDNDVVQSPKMELIGLEHMQPRSIDALDQSAYTDRARQCLVIAGQYVLSKKTTTVDIEHILYGLLKEGAGVASTCLQNAGITQDKMNQTLLAYHRRKLE